MSAFNSGQGNPYPGSFPTLTGIYGGPPPPGMMPFYRPNASGLAYDTFQLQNQQRKKEPWYAIAAKEVAKTGLIVGASVLGGIVGQAPGAMAAGAAAAGLVSVFDQKLSHGKINWGSALVDTTVGLIPAGIGGALMKGIQRLTGKTLFETAGKQTLKHVVAKGVTLGAVDGAAIGYAGGLARNAMNDYQQTGKINWKQAHHSGVNSVVSGALGGAVAGGMMNGLVFHQSAKSGQKGQHKTGNSGQPERAASSGSNPATLQAPTDAMLQNLKPPKRTFFNRMMAYISLKSDDAMLGNFHAVDDHVLRGAMPESAEAFTHLRKKHNVQTIIDLRGAETTKPQYIQYEMGHARNNGIRYVSMPMNSHVAPTQAELQTFMKAIEETRQSGGKVYIHCKHGIDRTGSMVAAYEVAGGKAQEVAFNNMRKYGYNLQHEWSRPDQKAFVLGENLPQTMKTAQAGAQLQIQADRLLKSNQLSQDVYGQILSLLEKGQIIEAKKLLF